MNNVVEEWTFKDISCLKYLLIVCCDVERCFSKYKSMLNDNLRNLQFKNIFCYFMLVFISKLIYYTFLNKLYVIVKYVSKSELFF